MAKKVKFGFKNLYYAPITESGYGTPKQIPGAVSMTLSKSGEDVDFYADDVDYFRESVNNGYEGSLEIALIPDDFKTDCLGFSVDSNGVLVENANGTQKPFALLCETTNDEGATRYAFLNCMASRPEISSTTKTETKEVQTETLDIKITPNADGIVLYSTTEEVDSTVYNGWFTEVYDGASASI